MKNTEGTFDVIMRNPEWTAKDDNSMALRILCEAKDNHEDYEYFFMHFTATMIQKGDNAGTTVAEKSANDCLDLGMSVPFDPAKIGELDGKPARLVIGKKTNNKTKKEEIVPLYLNRPLDSIPVDQAQRIWNTLTGGAVVGAATTTGQAAAENDPFA
jgi:hypothetical protein